MGYLNATPEDEANFSQLGQGDAGTNQLPGPTAWQGAIESVPQGIASGIADAYQFSRDVENGVATFAGKHPWAYGIPGIGATAAAYNTIPDDYKKNADKIRQQVADWGKIDPQLTGSVGQFAQPLTKGLTEMAIGSPAGPVGAALMAGGSTADEGYRTGKQEGLDSRTAGVLAGEQGIFAGVAAFLPVRFAGPLLKSTLKAGTVYTGLGIAQREMQHDALATNGYEDMAAAVKPFDLKSMAADFLMASFVNAGAKMFGKPEAAPRPLPSEVDGASAVQVDAHAERAGFGVATDPETAGLHSQTLAEHIDAMLHDRPMPEIAPEAAQKMADGVIADPQQMEMFKTVQETVNADPLLADAQIGHEPTQTGQDLRRRASDVLDDFNTLRAREKAGETLTYAEQARLKAGYELERTTARIAGTGRLMPGIRNMLAFNEAHDAGQLPGHIGMIDADNFKAVNDQLGHAQGDAVIEHIANTLAKHFGAGNVFHKGGDEFLVTGESPEGMRQGYQNVNADLAGHRLVVRHPDGTGLEYPAPRVSGGFAKRQENVQESINAADQALQAEKAARLARGERTERGQPNDVRGNPAGRAEAGNAAGQQGSAAGANGPKEVASATGDPVHDDILDSLVASHGSDVVTMPDGTQKTVTQFADELRERMAEVEGESRLIDVAVACFLRTGGAA